MARTVTVELTEAQARAALDALAYWSELARMGEGDLEGTPAATVAAARRAADSIRAAMYG